MHNCDHGSITRDHVISNMFGLTVMIAKLFMFCFFVLSLNIEIKQK